MATWDGKTAKVLANAAERLCLKSDAPFDVWKTAESIGMLIENVMVGMLPSVQLCCDEFKFLVAESKGNNSELYTHSNKLSATVLLLHNCHCCPVVWATALIKNSWLQKSDLLLLCSVVLMEHISSIQQPLLFHAPVRAAHPFQEWSGV